MELPLSFYRRFNFSTTRVTRSNFSKNFRFYIYVMDRRALQDFVISQINFCQIKFKKEISEYLILFAAGCTYHREIRVILGKYMCMSFHLM